VNPELIEALPRFLDTQLNLTYTRAIKKRVELISVNTAEIIEGDFRFIFLERRKI